MPRLHGNVTSMDLSLRVSEWMTFVDSRPTFYVVFDIYVQISEGGSGTSVCADVCS